jgi:hypothetical protein
MVDTGERNAAPFLVLLTRLLAGAAKQVSLIVDHWSVHEAAAVEQWWAGKADRIEVFTAPVSAPGRDPEGDRNGAVTATIDTDGLPTDREELRGKRPRFLRELADLPARIASDFEHKDIAYAAAPELNPT